MPTEIVYTRLYRCPGPNAGPKGTTYESRALATQAEIDLLMQDPNKWSPTLDEAVESYLLAKSNSASVDLPSTATPEERAAAAEAIQAQAAADLNTANENLAADQAAYSVAGEVLAKILAEYDDATRAKVDFDARYADLLARKTVAEKAAQEKGKTLASSTLRQAAADRTLDDAATKVIATGSVLTTAKKKALDAAAAKQKALAAAQAKEAAAAASAAKEAADAAAKAGTAPILPPDPPPPPGPPPEPAAQPGVRSKKAAL